MKLTVKQLKQLIKEAILEQTMAYPDMPLLTSVEPEFQAALSQIFKGLDAYKSVMNTLAQTGKAVTTKRVATKGIRTADQMKNDLGTMVNDLEVAKHAVRN